MSIDNSVSINNAITVDSYEIVDNLGLVDETVVVDIVDALFTSTNADWAVTDPDSPFYIKHKPTRTSEFINDGENGLSRYVQFSDLPSVVGKVADVQVKTAAEYYSVLEDGIAKIDLTPFVQKEHKTGSESEYKVLSDNNLSDALLAKINIISTLGTGNRVLSDDGTYKDNYNILTVNGVSPDGNKNVLITPENITYGGVSLAALLGKTVMFDSASDKSITLDNNKAIKAKTTSSSIVELFKLDSNGQFILGSSSVEMKLLSSARPKVGEEDMAYISDITSRISQHNESTTAHNDIRVALLELFATGVIFATNSEMQEYITSGVLENGKIVMAVDEGIYAAGKFYKFVTGSPNSFTLISDYQYENIYGASAPSDYTVGKVGQLYYDIQNLRIYRCSQVSNGLYSWDNITPGEGNSAAIQGILNNTRLISDANGGFTAGNNYVLLLPNGTIPAARIPQNVLTGLKYGGSFDGNGTITASSNCPELDGLDISTINLPPYVNFYFYCSATYTLGGETYQPGEFALDGGNEWVRITHINQVDSVNGKTGVVVLDYSDVGAIAATEKGANSGVASLDENGKLTSGQIPVSVAQHLQDTNNPHSVTAAQVGAYTTGEVDIITGGLDARIQSIEGIIPSEATSSNKLADKSYVDAVGTRVSTIEGLIPVGATPQNYLTDKDYVDTAINGLIAAYITRNAAGDPFRTKAELDGTSTYYSGGSVRVPTQNDYLYVLYDESQATTASGYSVFSTTADYVGYYVMYNMAAQLVTNSNKDSLGIDPGITVAYVEIPSTRYIRSGSIWAFQFIVNNTGFNSEQMAAINSGITRALVDKLTGIEAGAQVNVIETIYDSVGNALPVVSKAVTLPNVSIRRLGA